MKIVILFLAVASVGWAAEKKYEIKGYPKSGDCHRIARELGERFQQLTGVEVFDSRCTLISEKSFDFRITYESATKLSLVSTYDIGSLLDGQGSFATEKECLAALPGETAYFTQATGLQPLVSFCSYESLDHDYPWGPRIDSFGKATLKPLRSGAHIFGKVLGYSLSTFTQSLVGNLREEGIDARWARVRAGGMLGRVTVFYYGTERIPLDSFETVKVSTQASCEATLVDMKAVLRDYRPLPAMAFCAAENVGGYFEIALMFPGERSLRFTFAAETYSTHAMCEADRERLVAYYQTDVRRPVVAGYCSWDTQRNWRVLLLETKK